MMQTFSTYTTPRPLFLTEAKNTHIPHLEDLILDAGANGVASALAILSELGEVLNGGEVSHTLNISVKWDGAPALVFGMDPDDDRFFVSTKSAFSMVPKLAKSHEDINQYWSGDLAAILHVAFDTLAFSCHQGVYQGDCLYTLSTISPMLIDGQMYLTFCPNTITYAIKQDSELGVRLAASRFGIVVHTMYVGRGSLSTYDAFPVSPDAFAALIPTADVVLLDSHFDDVSGTMMFSEDERADFDLAFEDARVTGQVDARTFDAVQSEPLHTYLQVFINARSREIQHVDPLATVKDFQVFLLDRQTKALTARKTDKGRVSAQLHFESLLTIVGDNQFGLVSWFRLYDALIRVKNIVVRALVQASPVATYIESPDGYQVTGPEGFVVVTAENLAVKLVDRSEFSRLNLVVSKDWK